MSNPFQIQYRATDHSKGPDYWQPTRVFKTASAAQIAAAKTRASGDFIAVRVIDRRTGEEIAPGAERTEA